VLKRDRRKELMNDNAVKAKGVMALWWGKCLKLSKDAWRAIMRKAQQRVY